MMHRVIGGTTIRVGRFYRPDRGRDFEEGSKCPARAHVPFPAANILASRARSVGLNGKTPVRIPLTQQHIADTLGLSLVHTNKTIRKLMDRKLILWRDGGCEVVDHEGLKTLAHWEGLGEERRPLI